jgi:ephrin-B
VACDACSYSVTYIPNTERFNETKITISGLQPVSQYNFKVFAENGVTAKAGEPEFVEITVTTEASVPSSVTNVKAISATASEVALTWDLPYDVQELEMFEVRYFVKGRDANGTIIRAGRVAKHTFENLKQKTDYGFQVRAKTSSGYGEWSSTVYKRTGQVMASFVGSEEEAYSHQGFMITIIAVAVALLFVFLIIAAALFLRG